MLLLSTNLPLPVIIVYGVFLWFQFYPATSEEDDADAATAGHAAEDEEEEDELELTLPAAMAGLAGVSVLTAITSNALVNSIDGAAHAWGVPIAFIATVLLPIVVRLPTP
jgi:Ca2+:H+ antiporter